jgi:magnesium transporter
MEVNKNHAGFYISLNIPVVLGGDKVSKIENYLKSHLYNFEETTYVYVVDDQRNFLGSFPVNKLSKYSKDKTALEICKKIERISVKETDKRDYAVHLALKHNISSIPVVDNQERFKGVIKNINILKLLHKEHTEERFLLSGVSKSHVEIDSVMNMPILTSIKHRAVWLLIGLVGGLFAAKIIGSFEATLQAHIIIAAFIPLVVYISDAVGTQLEAFAIRDLVLFKNMEFSDYFSRQLLSVFIISVILGLSAGIISFFMYKNLQISAVLSMAIIVATLSSIITGLLIPFIFRKLKKDPANGSGPIGTIIQDLLSIIIYFVIAKNLL